MTEPKTPTWDYKTTVNNPAETHQLGVKLGQQLRAGDLVLLTGDLGAGKTTLSRGIGEGLNIRGPVTSPTFVIARTHPPLEKGRAPLIHVDAYRLQNPEELDDLDLDMQNSVVLIEWGKGLINPGINFLEIILERPKGENSTSFDSEEEPRSLTFYGFGERFLAGLNLKDTNE